MDKDKQEDKPSMTTDSVTASNVDKPQEDAPVQSALTDRDRQLLGVVKRREIRKKKAKGRYKRVPMSGANRLDFKPIDGLHLHLMNDVPGRLSNAIDGGYTPVTSEEVDDYEGTRTGDYSEPGSLVTRNVGGGITGYLMKIPQVLYDADQKAKQDKIDVAENLMESDDTTRPDSSGLYGGYKIEKGKIPASVAGDV